MRLLSKNKETQKIEMCKVIPDTRIYSRLGQVGYSTRDALSELIDNSLDARKQNKKLTVEVEFDTDNNAIRVIDNGTGMSKDQTRDAITLAKSDKKNKLGFFGLGLKTAGMAIGSILHIKTKQENSDKVHSVILDSEDFEKNNNWELPISTKIDTLQEQGTIIVIEEVKKMPSIQSISTLRKHFSDRYKSFINSGDLSLFVAGIECEPITPEYILEQPINLETKTLNRIKGVLRIQTKRSQKKMEYGFDIYKNQRIITSNDKIGFGGAHGEKALICGELHFDFCPVNFSKNEFLRYTDEYLAAENEIKCYLRPLMKLFNTKNLKKDKIEKLLEIQKETGKIPNLNEFKDIMKKLEEGSDDLIVNHAVNFSSEEPINNCETETIANLPKHEILFSHIEMSNTSLAKINSLLKEIEDSKGHLEEFKGDSNAKMQLAVFAESLMDSAKLANSLLEEN